MDDPNLNFAFPSKLSRNMFNNPNLTTFNTSFDFGSSNLPFHLRSSSSPESPPYSASAETTSDESVDFSHPHDHTAPSKSWTSDRRRRSDKARNLLPEEQILKRRVQNRAAQRSFRERQKEYVAELEQHVEQLKEQVSRLQENYQGLLNALTVQPTAIEMSPSSLDGLELSGEMIGGGVFPPDMGNEYQGFLYT